MKQEKYNYRPAFERDWAFYVANRHQFNFGGVAPPEIIDDGDGSTAKYAFYVWDSTGRMIPCREPDLLREVITCKKSVNMNIKAWVEGFAEMMEPIDFYLSEFIDPPEWVTKAFVEQLTKRGVPPLGLIRYRWACERYEMPPQPSQVQYFLEQGHQYEQAQTTQEQTRQASEGDTV